MTHVIDLTLSPVVESQKVVIDLTSSAPLDVLSIEQRALQVKSILKKSFDDSRHSTSGDGRTNQVRLLHGRRSAWSRVGDSERVQIWDLVKENITKVYADEWSEQCGQQCWKWVSFSAHNKKYQGQVSKLIPFTEATGYSVISAGHGKPKLHVYHLSWLINNAKNVISALEVDTSNISHLCHDKLCINPAHLAKEGIQANARRNKCQAWQWNNGVRVAACGHQPPCIARDS